MSDVKVSGAGPRQHGGAIGCYARDLRLEWAVEQLRRTDRPISGIAAAAGFSDQSHFTRERAARLGAPPGRLRKRLRSDG